MAINPPNPGTYLADLSARITALRNAFSGDHGIVIANNYVLAMGGKAFLTALPADGGIGMASGDADTLLAALGGLANQPSLATALTNSTTTWGGN